MTTDKHKPALSFFRQYPEDILDLHPLLSALQTLETCFLLIAMNRYPSAQVTCSAVIESTIKAALCKAAEDSGNFNVLMKEARGKFHNLALYDNADLHQFRKLRNQIAHYGYSPEDEQISVEAILDTGFATVDGFLEICFGFTLAESLHPKIAQHLDAAMYSRRLTKTQQQADAMSCIRSLAHMVRWLIKDDLLAHWEVSTLAEAESSLGDFDAKDALKDRLERSYNAFWQYDCPVCSEPNGFIAELDADVLDDGETRVIRGTCIGCGLRLPASSTVLTEYLHRTEIAVSRDAVLAAYGISSG